MKSKVITALVAVGIMASVSNAEIISKNGVAQDSATGLMWQDEPYIGDENNAYNNRKNDGKAGNWNYAKAYCENLTLGGFRDWRLPNVYELTTLIDHTKSNKPYVVDGLEARYDMTWSSSTYYTLYDDYIDQSKYALSAAYNPSNIVSAYDKDEIYLNVRCVRGKELSFNNLVILKNKEKIKVSEIVIEKISQKKVAKCKEEAEIYYREKAQKEAQKRAEKEKQAEYDRKHQCDGFYPGKNFKVHTTGLLGGDEEARVTGVDKEGGQVSFEWKRGPGDWKSEETTCSYLKTQMR